ncbi:MAG: serine/threonine-protein kinase, partial [Thermoanaerobaculia bacterium]
MSLTPGTRLGPYEVLSPIGAGGMGEVYRAKDSKLKRDVAIKVLPESLANDADALSRFEREAHAVAALNHPNILSIHDFGNENGVAYAVTELLEGETLRAKVEGGALPQRRAVEIAIQIAKGLAAAHEKGIVHRDLKPANVMVTPQGKVKILDLGLAKAMEAPSTPDDLSKASTVAEETLPGVILGTIGYMSPEQARGNPIDKRTDIWAFGCILFECLAGQRAFSGGNVSDVIASILRSEPKWPDLPDDTPQDIRELLVRCLEKESGQRLRDIGDAR